MSQEENQPHNPIDVSMKMLFRRRPEAALSLAGLEIEPQTVRFEDSSVIVRELHADHVMILETPPMAIYWEYQLTPRLENVRRWFAKCAGLSFQLQTPVALIVIYLEKGDYASFHDRIEVDLGRAKTLFQFTTVKLWEHTDRIRSGELVELAPFLYLCESHPGEETVQEELDLIHRANLKQEDQVELYLAVFRIAASRLPKETINKLYRENESMIKENFAYDPIREILLEEGSRRRLLGLTSKLLSQRLGAIPTAVREHLERASDVELEKIFDQAMKIESYDELRLNS